VYNGKAAISTTTTITSPLIVKQPQDEFFQPNDGIYKQQINEK
jgi:hypothetical protein